MWSIISAAGWPIWPLILGSVVALAIVLERIKTLRKKNFLPATLVTDVCKALPPRKDKQFISRLEAHSALGNLMASGLSAFYKNENIETAMQEKSIGIQNTMEKHLDLLAMIASAAPLMGLLGTVIGMIDIFAVQGGGAQTPETIAKGISMALYNTAFGLIVAIPAMVAYRLFKMRVNNLLGEMGDALKPFEELLKLHSANRRKTGSGELS